MLDIYVDSDACPVKKEVARVAKRLHLKVFYVAQSSMRIPDEGDTTLIVVEYNKLDAADDWIVEHITKDDIVVTDDVPLVHRCIQAGARVIGPQGRLFTDENIGNLLATRDLMHALRGAGEISGGPAPFQNEDRSRFLEGLDRIIQDIKKIKSSS